MKLELEVVCRKFSYYYDSVNDFITDSGKYTERIEKLTYIASFDSNNKIQIVFRNRDYNYLKSSIDYTFDNEQEYYTLKNKIEPIIKNNRVDYSLFATLPLLPILGTVIFLFLWFYTSSKGIVYPEFIQYIIIMVFILMLEAPILPPIQGLKNLFFPPAEFRFGVNTNFYKTMGRLRYFVGGAIITGIIVGLLANYISKFIL